MNGCKEQAPKQSSKQQVHQERTVKSEVDLIKKYDHEIREYYRELAEVGLDGVTVMPIDKKVEYTDLAVELNFEILKRMGFLPVSDAEAQKAIKKYYNIDISESNNSLFKKGLRRYVFKDGLPQERLDQRRSMDDGATETLFCFWYRNIFVPKYNYIIFHPIIEGATLLEGFDDEDAAGIAIDAPNRNYKDRNHKPEMVLALTRYEAVSGFRTPRRAIEVVDGLKSPLACTVAEFLHANPTRFGIKKAFSWLLSPQTRPTAEQVEQLVDEVAARAAAGASPSPRLDAYIMAMQAAFPGDPGVAAALLLNPVTLNPGEALVVPAGAGGRRFLRQHRRAAGVAGLRGPRAGGAGGGGGGCGGLGGSQYKGGVVAFSGRHGLVYGLRDGYLAALYLYVSYLYTALVGEAVDAQRAHVLVGLG